MLKLFKKIFFNTDEITEKQYLVSRWGFVLQAMCSASLCGLAGGAYLTGLLSQLGASEALISAVVAMASLAGLMQLISPFAAEKISRNKLPVTIGAGFSKFMLAFIMLTPIIIPNKVIAMVVSVMFYLIYNLSNAFVSPMFSIWFISLVPKQIRGKYFGIKDSLTFLAVAVSGYAGGYMIDLYINDGNSAMGFFVLGCVLMVVALVECICYIIIKEPRREKLPSEKVKIKDIITKPFKNKQFYPVIILHILYSVAIGLVSSLTSIYRVSRLEMSYEFIALTASVNSILRMLMSLLWGRLAAKKSWHTSLVYAFIALAISNLVWVFVTKENMYWMAWLETIISPIAYAGIGLALYGFQFDNMPEKNRSIYISCNGAISGVATFASGMAASAFIALANGASVSIGGFVISDIQFVFAVSTLLCIICAWYVLKLGLCN